jgi:two-component system chemotaxis response regulator CheB
VGVILIVIGKDGAKGMAEMEQAGAYNFARDEKTCVVYGMLKEAVACGGVDEILPLHEIAKRVMALVGNVRLIRV